MGEYTMTRTDLQLQAADKIERAAALIRELTEAGCYVVSLSWYNTEVKIHCCIHSMYTKEDDFYRWAAAHGAELEAMPDETVYIYRIHCEVDEVIVFALATAEDAAKYIVINKEETHEAI